MAPSIGSVWKYTLLTLTFIVSRHFLWPGQEAHEGVVWRTGSSAELLQLHSSRIERNVPQILHPLPAFQSPEVPSSLGWIYNCDLFWTLHRKLRFFFLCWLLSSQEYSAIFWSQYGSWRDHGNQLSKWTFNWSFTREKGVKAVQHNVDPLWHPSSTTDLFILSLNQESCSDFMT